MDGYPSLSTIIVLVSTEFSISAASMSPSDSLTVYALATPADGVHEAFYTSFALFSIVSSTPSDSVAQPLIRLFPSGFSCSAYR